MRFPSSPHVQRVFTIDAAQVAAYLIRQVPPGGNAVTKAGQAVHGAAETLTQFLGSDGCHAVFTRALQLAGDQNPVLKTITFKTVPSLNLSGVTEGIELYGETACASALELLLSTVVVVLNRLIGEDLALRILEGPYGP